MNRSICIWLLLPCLIFALASCEGSQESDQSDPVLKTSQQLKDAIQDLSGRLSVSPDDIRVITEKNVTWRDGSLGCPQKGMMYTQALVPGTLIVLRVDDTEYEYHSGGGRAPFYCENPVSPASNSSAD